MFPGHRRALLLATLALAIPLPALALTGETAQAPPAPAALSVSTSLDSCGVAEAQVICKLDVSFGAVPGATSYTASVTRADGSVVDYGEVGAGGGALWVPYTGAGNYSVRISAFGEPPVAEPTSPDETGNEPIATGTTETSAVDPADAGNASAPENPGQRDDGSGQQGPAANAAIADDPGANPDAPAPAASSCAPEQAPAPVPATPAEPLPEPPPPDTDPANPDEDGDGVDDAEERAAYELALSEQEAAALAAEAQLPAAVNCAQPITP